MTTYSLGEIPPEPEDHSVVLAASGIGWQRKGNKWFPTGAVIPLMGDSKLSREWSRLLLESGPLTLLAPADTDAMDAMDAGLALANAARPLVEVYRTGGAERLTSALSDALRDWDAARGATE